MEKEDYKYLLYIKGKEKGRQNYPENFIKFLLYLNRNSFSSFIKITIP